MIQWAHTTFASSVTATTTHKFSELLNATWCHARGTFMHQHGNGIASRKIRGGCAASPVPFACSHSDSRTENVASKLCEEVLHCSIGQYCLSTMGMIKAQSYANIFMGSLESQLLSSVERKPDVWWRYIDDVFTIWAFSEGCLKE